MSIDPKLYDEIKKKIPLPCVDLLITHKKSLLLMLRNNEPAKDLWFTPGGRINRNESLEEAEEYLETRAGLESVVVS
ncbi:MAG: hypothetical protein JRJ66_16270 [Deltaproteobacteria bacterium]|nr:hypothetical protein [Deltaproteobacteria bacterium]